jgi:hypothetical protein
MHPALLMRGAIANYMEKEIIYNLIDSLQGLSHLPPEQMTGQIVASIKNWAQPEAVIAKITDSGRHTNQDSFGNSHQVDILAAFEKRFLSLDVTSALLSLGDNNRHLVAAALIKSPTGHHGVILLLIKPDNPFKHLSTEILNLYADQVVLALATHPSRASVDLADILPEASQMLLHMGVDGILAVDSRQPEEGFWIEKQSKKIKEIPIDDKLSGQIRQPGNYFADKPDTRSKPDLPFDGDFKSIAWTNFAIGEITLNVLFAGSFKDSELLFSRFRSFLAEMYLPLGYDEITRAFKQLLDDHRQVIKGERIAAILETAVAVNHEINNPLTAILGNTQLILLNKDKLSKDLLAKINIIEKSALRIRQVTQKLMAVVEPITTPYVDGLQMLDIDKSSSPE